MCIFYTYIVTLTLNDTTTDHQIGPHYVYETTKNTIRYTLFLNIRNIYNKKKLIIKLVLLLNIEVKYNKKEY